MSNIEKALLFTVYAGVFLLLFTPFIIANSFFFPFITGKNFFFRIIVELSFSAWAILAILRPEFRPQKSPVLISFSFFIAIVGIAAVFGADIYHSFWSNFERMEGYITHIHLLALFFVVACTFKDSKIWAWFFSLSAAISIIVAFHAYLQSLGSLDIIGGGRPFARFGNSIYLAVYLLFHLFVISGLAYSIRNIYARIGLSAAFIFELHVFLVAASRGALLGLIAGITIVAILLIYSSRKTYIKIFSSIAILFIFFGAFVVFKFPNNYVVENVEVLSRFSSVSLDDISQDPRIMIWGMAINAFKERPILGWGPENFIIPYGKYYNPDLFAHEPWFDRTHNMFLEWLVGAGIIGFSAYLSVLASVAYVMFKLFRLKKINTVMAIIFVSFLAAYLVQNAFVFDNIMTYILLISFFAYVHSMYKEKDIKYSRRTKDLTFLQVAGSAGVFVLAVIIGVLLNVKPMLAANQIIVALQSVQKENGIEKVINEYNKVIEYNTFGTTEARERVSDMVVQVALNVEGTNEAFNKLLDYSISEMEKETKAQEQVAKYPLFLGKLYAIKGNLSGSGLEKSEENYLKALEIAPNYVQTYLGLAETYLLMGENDKALESVLRAYSLQNKDARTRSALFHPVLAVHVLAGKFPEASKLMNDFWVQISEPILSPLALEEIELLIQRANRSRDSIELAEFYESWNNMFIKDYGFAHPYLIGELARIYNSIGLNKKTKEAISLLSGEDIKNLVRDFSKTQSGIEPSLKENADKLIESVEKFP